MEPESKLWITLQGNKAIGILTPSIETKRTSRNASLPQQADTAPPASMEPPFPEAPLAFFQHCQIGVQPFAHIAGEKLLHGREVMLHMEGIEGVIVGEPVS